MENIEQDHVPPFEPGDWIVHLQHGVGQVKAVETKRIGGKESSYYRVRCRRSVIWVPVEGDVEMRRVAPPNRFQQAIEVFRRPARKLSSNYRTRQARIRKERQKGSPAAIARLLRDLWFRRSQRGKLSNTESRDFKSMKERLLAEWSASMQMDQDQAEQRLTDLLQSTTPPETGD